MIWFSRLKRQRKSSMYINTCRPSFFSVVCSHYWPPEGSKLFQYLFEILDIHSQGGNFLNYDRQFRMIRESTHRPWDRPLESFYVKSILRKDSQTPNTNNSNNKRFHITSRFGGRSSATNIDDHSLIKRPPWQIWHWLIQMHVSSGFLCLLMNWGILFDKRKPKPHNTETSYFLHPPIFHHPICNGDNLSLF